MRFISTRGKSTPATIEEAIQKSLADDGGLYVPESFPAFSSRDFAGKDSLPAVAQTWLSPFFEKSLLQGQLPEICSSVFDFPIPLTGLEPKASILELFHGPTAAFKDFGARFLAACLTRLPWGGQTRSVMVATSGDTGSAVAAAFHRLPGFEVILLYPKGKVSKRQEKQLTCWGDNVHAFAARGTFDDCQAMVKAAFSDPWWKQNKSLVSANSINLGRLLPQGAYYAYASLKYFRQSKAIAGFIVPTGNLGNAMAALWAKRTGLPIGKVCLATNANRPIPNFFQTGVWQPQNTIETLANAMDVGNASNMERLRNLYPEMADLKTDVEAVSVSDKEITETIQTWGKARNTVICPHTATAGRAWASRSPGHWIIVATAHPAKFDTIVEPLVGHPIEVPPALAALLSKKAHFKEIDADLKSLQLALSPL